MTPQQFEDTLNWPHGLTVRRVVVRGPHHMVSWYDANDTFRAKLFGELDDSALAYMRAALYGRKITISDLLTEIMRERVAPAPEKVMTCSNAHGTGVDIRPSAT